MRGPRRAPVFQVAGDLVRRLGLEAHVARPVATYSGGTRRKLSTALALLGRPDLLLLVRAWGRRGCNWGGTPPPRGLGPRGPFAVTCCSCRVSTPTRSDAALGFHRSEVCFWTSHLHAPNRTSSETVTLETVSKDAGARLYSETPPTLVPRPGDLRL